MKALVYHGVGRRSWEDVAGPVVSDPDDAIIRVDTVTICGTDLHILKGDVPEVEAGRILGHEAVGTVVDAGPGVRTVRPGDRVLVSCISACGRCRSCRGAAYGQCTGGGGWILGHLVDGTQAEFVRTPFADTSLYRLPEGVDDDAAVLLADILPTSYEVGVRNGRVGPGGHVANVGVHGRPATLHLEDLWIKNVTITTGLVDTNSTPMLLDMLHAGRLDIGGLVTHRFGLDEMQDAYDVFSHAADTGALKVVLFRR